MAQIKIAVVVGSIRKDSFNKKFALALAKLAAPDVTFAHVVIDDLPLYNQDDDASPGVAVTRLKASIGASAGVLFVTPEPRKSIRN